MKKTIIILDDVHEYDYELVNRTYTLYYSLGEQWGDSTKGTVAMSVTDTGNGLKIGGEQKKKNNFDYMEGLHLTILLKIIHKDYKFEIAEKIEF